MKNKEIWRPVKGFDFAYEVSNFGRVRSLNRVVDSKEGVIKGIKGRILKEAMSTNKYYVVTLWKNNASKTMTIHQLIAEAFLNHNQNSRKIVIDHIDNNKLNNNVNNLQIITARENTSKDRKGGTSKYIGVSWAKNGKKWRSAIRSNGELILLGYYDDELEAAKAYQDKLNSILIK